MNLRNPLRLRKSNSVEGKLSERAVKSRHKFRNRARCVSWAECRMDIQNTLSSGLETALLWPVFLKCGPQIPYYGITQNNPEQCQGTCLLSKHPQGIRTHQNLRNIGQMILSTGIALNVAYMPVEKRKSIYLYQNSLVRPGFDLSTWVPHRYLKLTGTKLNFWSS